MFKELIQKMTFVFRSVREYKKYAIITPLFMVGEAAVECGIPFVMSLLIDQIEMASKTSNINVIWPFIFILLGMAAVSIICGILGGVFAAKASTGFAKNLRHDLYTKIQSFSFANIDKFSSSSLITRMTTDVTNSQQAFQLVIRIVVRAPLMLIFSIVMGFISGGVLAVTFVVLIPVILFGLYFIAKKALPIFRRIFKKYDKLNESVEENVSGIRVVKSYVREDFETKKFIKASDDIANESIKAEKILAYNNPLMNTTVHISNIVILALGSYLIIKGATLDSDGAIIWGNITPSQMSACITYGLQVLMNLMMISMIAVMLVMSLESMRRIGEVLEEESTIKNPENALTVVENGDVEFKNVNFKYSETAEKNALEGINLKIKSGQYVGVIGSTGSGKTSIINLISRLYDVTDGEVIVSGHNVKEYDLTTLRDSVAVVLQKNVLFSGSIADNLRWGNLNASDDDLKRVCHIARADEFIDSFPEGYKTHIEQGGTNVSGGQKQRLCIARALLKDPKVLILDDSTSAVDTKTDAMIRKALKEDIPNTTKIIVAQRISSIEDADLIIVMDNGKISAFGTHDELMKKSEIYRDVFTSQTKKGGLE